MVAEFRGATCFDGPLGNDRVISGSIPVIEFDRFLHGSDQERRIVADEIAVACRDSGIFTVVNHDVPDHLVRRAMDVSAEFFSGPGDVKRAIDIAASPCGRGWFPIGSENLDPVRQQHAGDLREGFRFGEDLAPNHVLVERHVPLHGPNQWPSTPASLTPTLRRYFALVQNLADEVLRCLAIALGLEPAYFEASSALPMSTALLAHYPAQRGVITEGQIGAGAHRDAGVLTIIAQDDVGGLQVQTTPDTWVNVQPVTDGLVVGVGDMLARWTNDVLTSSVHRVINYHDRSRYSIPFFHTPSWDTSIEAISTCVDADHPARYASTTALRLLLERIATA